ncbi:hypothetical protein PFICI_02565 [Pestalotiopsis fici W106-1]|uniref:Uncharacterized protein n=1 Tax=Pestalotiopsis fici (strain W106-1 / CGMCC3.15140) TaxID=1229662 RepID=W3XER3_PESFW|nr:uncharacterized protein PFICI_02565 [Pestalotiopsis fici W106-1]ETS84540.1 hypothetical protein PFICI_02565 [Pestalotiopsis fici W106-1]
MTSLSKQSIPIFTKYLHNLSAIVRKAETFANEKSIKHEEVINYRLISDMRGLAYQVQSCCNTVAFFVERVSGVEHVAVEDNEETFDQLCGRIDRTVDYLSKADTESIDKGVDSPIIMETKMGNFRFESGQTYFSEYCLANFHFHLGSAYCILRTQGVPLGAFDYLKDVFHKVE